MATTVDPDGLQTDDAAPAPTTGGPSTPTRRRGTVRRWAMRPRRSLVKVHRWLSCVLVAWLVVGYLVMGGPR